VFQRSRVSDHSGIEALDGLADRYQKLGKTLHIRHLSPECVVLLKKAGNLCEVNVLEDPDYHVVSDELG
jgi:SulP family sulfate permease